MTLFQAFLSGLTGTAIVFLLLNLHLLFYTRQPRYLAAALASLGIAIYVPCNMLLYQTLSPDAYLSIVQVQMFGTAFFMLGLIWFYLEFLSIDTRRPLTIYASVLSIFLIARLANKGLYYASFSGMTPFTFAWGETVQLPLAVTNIWSHIYLLAILSVYPVLAAACAIAWRRGNKKRAGQALFALFFIFAALVHDSLVLAFDWRWLFLGEVGYIMLLVSLQAAMNSEILQINRLTQKLSELNADLEHRVALRTADLAAANHDLEAFSYSVSHDLQAPLRQIEGYAQLLRPELGEGVSAVTHEYLDHMLSGAARMNRLIDALLQMARLGVQSIRCSEVDLNEIAGSVFAEFAATIKERNIVCQIERLPAARGDAVLLRQVFTNLIANAIKYTGRTEHPEIHVGTLNAGGESVYFVRDNGAGFDMKFADRLFGVFQRLHAETEFSGTGVGLATVQRILRKHGGRIWAEAELGKGATFYFTFGPP